MIVNFPIIYFIRNTNKEDIWNFVGSEKLFDLINKEITWSRKKIKIFLNNNDFDFNNFDQKNIKGIFLNDFQ